VLVDVREQILAASNVYTPSERRVADACLNAYPTVAFETVASIARRSGTSPPTVIRFATKAGFTGFSELQQHVRASVEEDWTRALDRLERTDRPGSNWLDRGLQADLENLVRTYHGVGAEQFAQITALFADSRRHVYLAGGEITHGLCLSAAALLSWIRDDVFVLGRTPAELPTQLAAIKPGSVVLAFHLRRLTRRMHHIIDAAAIAGAETIVVTNSPTLPIPQGVRHVLVLHQQGAGSVLDSYTAAASLLNSLAAAIAHHHRRKLPTRFRRQEATWQIMDTYLE
jgi:DNA-binding MurR/RpiR family transcriptional regulator